MQRPGLTVDQNPLMGARIGVVADSYGALQDIEAALRQRRADVVRIPLRDADVRRTSDADLLLVYSPDFGRRNDDLAVLSELASRQRVIALMRQSRGVAVRGLSDMVFAPFRSDEVVLRAGRALAEPAPAVELSAGNLNLHPLSRTVVVAGERVPLTLEEFELLRALLAADGVVLSRDVIAHQLGHHPVLGRAIDTLIHRLRVKLHGLCGATIDTVRSVGYRLSTN
jgi:DNA-binding response OmpR family regulator